MASENQAQRDRLDIELCPAPGRQLVTAQSVPPSQALHFLPDGPIVSTAAAEVRLGCASLAHRLHLDGLSDDGATVLETARALAEFVEGTE
ncbi:hypothetical protein I5G97_gp001 [Mycobacterium phage Curiosium]|uniref:Gene 1 ring forming protein domain-containing protein n=1 Tax=Mycobacterium phage Curiosium TaxID=2599859 RepID=A0A5J6TVW1_9CAUD|nr:hypothetical protein I5G97_gp001 [Mycobacterium phage Curiosium]QFG14047.1 hypothetical protein PBI_CURIOSIUM_1 [Mycobacterium phage Curiosium]